MRLCKIVERSGAALSSASGGWPARGAVSGGVLLHLMTICLLAGAMLTSREIDRPTGETAILLKRDMRAGAGCPRNPAASYLTAK
jgi:hypothetical protein